MFYLVDFKRVVVKKGGLQKWVGKVQTNFRQSQNNDPGFSLRLKILTPMASLLQERSRCAELFSGKLTD
jgi:hypothetical protein